MKLNDIKIGETYYTVDILGMVRKVTFEQDTADGINFANNNAFSTEEEADKYELKVSEKRSNKSTDETILDMQYRILKNHVSVIENKDVMRQMNFAIVQNLLQQGTSKGGRTSSCEKCEELGIDPYGYTLERK